MLCRTYQQNEITRAYSNLATSLETSLPPPDPISQRLYKHNSLHLLVFHYDLILQAFHVCFFLAVASVHSVSRDEWSRGLSVSKHSLFEEVTCVGVDRKSVDVQSAEVTSDSEATELE